MNAMRRLPLLWFTATLLGVGHVGGPRPVSYHTTDTSSLRNRRLRFSFGLARWLIYFTDAGWGAMRTARRVIAEIEADHAQLVGAERLEAAAQTLDELLRGLASRQAA